MLCPHYAVMGDSVVFNNNMRLTALLYCLD